MSPTESDRSGDCRLGQTYQVAGRGQGSGQVQTVRCSRPQPDERTRVDDSTVMLVIVVATALVFDFTNGFHDTAN